MHRGFAAGGRRYLLQKQEQDKLVESRRSFGRPGPAEAKRRWARAKNSEFQPGPLARIQRSALRLGSHVPSTSANFTRFLDRPCRPGSVASATCASEPSRLRAARRSFDLSVSKGCASADATAGYAAGRCWQLRSRRARRFCFCLQVTVRSCRMLQILPCGSKSRMTSRAQCLCLPSKAIITCQHYLGANLGV